MEQAVQPGWRNAFDVMKTNYGLTNEAIGIFAINLRFNLDDIQTIASEALTGGGDDKKCDVLYVDKERQIAVIAQCYISDRMRAAAPANKASDLNTALTWLLSTDLDELPEALKGRADELRAAIDAGESNNFSFGMLTISHAPRMFRRSFARSRAPRGRHWPGTQAVGISTFLLKKSVNRGWIAYTPRPNGRLRGEFEAIPDAEYEGGRRGGASDAIKRSKFTLPSYTVGQSLAAFHGDPVTAYDKKSELSTNEKNYRHIFTERTTARHIVFCYSLLSAVNERKRELSQKQRADPASLTQIENNALAFLNKKGANYLLVHVISQCMETILARPMPNRFDLHFAKNLSPHAAEKLWLPIVNMMLSLSNQLGDAFSRNRISNESISKAVPNFVGVVASIRELQKETFEKFASQTKLGY